MQNSQSIIVLIGLEINLLFWRALERLSELSDYTPAGPLPTGAGPDRACLPVGRGGAGPEPSIMVQGRQGPRPLGGACGERSGQKGVQIALESYLTGLTPLDKP